MVQVKSPASFRPAGAFPSATRNAEIRDQLKALFNPPRAHLYSIGTVGSQFTGSFATRTPTVIGFDSTRGHLWYDEAYDGSQIVDAARLGFTIQVAGRYKIIANWSWVATSATSTRWLGIHQDTLLSANGTTLSTAAPMLAERYVQALTTTPTAPHINATTINIEVTEPLVQGTTLQICVWQNSTANINFDQASGQGRCFFEIRRVSS